MDPERIKELLEQRVPDGVEVTDFDGLSPHMSQTFADLIGDDATLEDLPPGEDLPSPLPEAQGGRYSVLGKVGEGGMGVVHLAKDQDLRRRVALKRLPAASARKRIRARRFLNEVQITAQLDHPNVVPVYSFDIAPDGSPAYAMKLIEGQTFREMLDEAEIRALKDQPPLEDNGLDDRIEVIIKICDAIAYAHDKGVIHRDLKPDNVMMGRFGEVYVMDWGLSRLAGSPDDEAMEAMESVDLEAVKDPAMRTRVGAVVGTPAWMSPEQARGDHELLGPWSDVYALGLMLYESVLLQPPYGDRNVFQILFAAESGRREHGETDAYGHRAPPDLLAIIDRATALESGERYVDAHALGAELRRFRANEETLALPDNLPRKIRRWIVSHPRGVALGIALLVLSFVALAAWQYYTEQLQEAEQRERTARNEHALTGFMGSVARQAQRIDNHFLVYESALDGLAETAEQALAFDLQGDTPPQELSRFKANPPPPGTAMAKLYNKPVNPRFAMHLCATATPEPACTRRASQIQALLPTFYDIFRVNPDGTMLPPGPEPIRQRVLEGEPPIPWAYVALEDTGLMYLYPGADGYDYGYDPRDRPFYLFGKELYHTRSGLKHRRGWSRPYVDLMGIGGIISAVQPLETPQGEFLGVAALDLALDYVVDTYLMPPEQKDVVGAWLVDGDGTVLMKTLGRDDPFAHPSDESDKYNAINHGPFLHEEVRAKIVAGQDGHVRVEREGYNNLVLGWARLQHLGWTYVLAVELKS